MHCTVYIHNAMYILCTVQCTLLSRMSLSSLHGNSWFWHLTGILLWKMTEACKTPFFFALFFFLTTYQACSTRSRKLHFILIASFTNALGIKKARYGVVLFLFLHFLISNKDTKAKLGFGFKSSAATAFLGPNTAKQIGFLVPLHNALHLDYILWFRKMQKITAHRGRRDEL